MTDGCRSRNILSPHRFLFSSSCFTVLGALMALLPVLPPTIHAAPATTLSPSLTVSFPSVPVANMGAANLSSFSYFPHGTDFF
jgi:hypothetical protein